MATVKLLAPRRLGARLALFAALVLACARRGPSVSPALAPGGSLPEGCAAVVSVDMVALGPLTDLLHAAVIPGAAVQTISSALDLRRDTRRTTVCRYANGSKADFIMLVLGTFASDAVESVATADTRAGRPGTLEIVGGLPALSSRGIWIAERPGTAGARELVLASQRELLNLALTGPAAPYWIDAGAGLSAVISGAEITRRVPPSDRETVFKAIREARISWKPDDGSLQMHLLVGDQALAEQMVPSIRSTVAVVLSRLSQIPAAATPPLVEAEGGDVTIHTSLRSDRLINLVARMASARSPKPM